MRIKLKSASFQLALCLALFACSTTQQISNEKPASYAMPDKYAAIAVEQVLRDGGNAVDAAIAAAFVLAVTFPEAGNIGGGGFMLARMNGANHFLDYREKAPLKASRDMYLNEDGSVIENASLIGIRAAGVPGTVNGLWLAHERFGTKSWASLIAPAIAYAEQGFEVHPKKAKAIPETIAWFDGKVNFSKHFGEMANGGVFKQPDLADVLKRIALSGPDDFYVGETSKLILAQSDRDNGLLTARDLAEYKSVWRTPLVADWRGYKVITAPPPSSGGFAVIQLLKMKELLDDEFRGLAPNSAQYIHLIAEMEKRVFADRAEYFGDPDFVTVPIDQLISDSYIKRRSAEVNVNAISDPEETTPGLESPNTTHFSIVDQWGNAVSNTYTLNWTYGSGVVVEGAGFILNNEMDDFSTKPGVANAYGVIGGTANEIQPSKRMLSSMSPTLLLDENDLRMVIGTPGGSTIFTSVFQGIVNVIDNDMTAQASVSASRFHHQLLPPDLSGTSISAPLEPDTIAELNQRGYRVEPNAWEFGDLQLIETSDGQTSAASDPRGLGVSGVIR
jgi:gamma-glutamyltranspeptidase/glutathione hydrolase